MKRTALTRRTAIRPKGWNKYGAIRTRDPLDVSRSFDSKGEAERGAMLRLLQRAGEISELQFQVTFHLTAAAIGYRADFVYVEKGRMVAEDFKGVETERFQIICRLWRHYGPCLLRVTKRAQWGWGFLVAQEIMPVPRNRLLPLE
jgi:hypothetical protein